MRDYIRRQGIEPPAVNPGDDLVEYQARLTLMQQSSALWYHASKVEGKQIDVYPLGTAENALKRRGMVSDLVTNPSTIDWSRDYIK